LILRSRKPEAQQFQRWVTHEVLPAIRKHGCYATATTIDQMLADPDTAIRLFTELKQERVERGKLEKKVERDRPKVEFYDEVTGSKDTVSIGQLAKVLNFPNVGQNKLFKFLRDNKILMRDNMPYQEYVDKGYFRCIEQKYQAGSTGETRISIKTVVFQRGVDFIRRLLKEAEATGKLPVSLSADSVLGDSDDDE